MVTPKFVDMENSFPEVVMAKINLDENEELGQEYNIESMPTFILFKRNEVVATYVGANMDKLKKIIEENQKNLS
nr:unnamed protein product [Callosobruchus chinensis]